MFYWEERAINYKTGYIEMFDLWVVKFCVENPLSIDSIMFSW